jgi:hypothetical protein
MAGRSRIIDDVTGGLENGPGDPNRATILIGSRGSGKTVLLRSISERASAIGWITANVTAEDGMLESIIEQAKRNAEHILPKESRKSISGIQAFGFGVTIESIPPNAPSWRFRMSDMLDILAKAGTGLLISVDEVDVKYQELVTLVSVFQHFIGEKKDVALMMAGLPGKVLQMFQHDTISFVRRAFQHDLSNVGIEEVKSAMRKTIEASGRTISEKALCEAAAYTEGFPFLIQLIGYYAWQESEGKTIDVSDVKQALLIAEENMDRMILDNTIRDLSDADVAFLVAMLPDPDISLMSDIRTRTGTTTQQAAQQRLRLIRSGVIEPYGRGKVRFQMPLLRKYLQKHHKG